MEINRIFEWSPTRFIVAYNGWDYVFRTREEAEKFLEKKEGVRE